MLRARCARFVVLAPALLASALLAPALLGCSGEHDPELTRVGGPLPEAGPPCVAAGPEGELPCDIDRVLTAKCRRCHNDDDPRPNFAPFSLMHFAGTRAVYAGAPVWQKMRVAVGTGFMPLQFPGLDPNGDPLTVEEKTALLAWLGACAPPAAADDACTLPAPDAP